MWKKVGLVNGAIGKIIDIIYPENNLENCLPDTIIVYFPIYTNHILINSFSCFSKTTFSTRTNYSLLNGYAFTVHKSQGATLKSGVIDLTEHGRNLGSSYIQLTRFKNFNDFLIQPFSYKRITKIIKNSKLLLPRIEVEKILEIMTRNTLNILSHLIYV